jgi:hypothetical protein
MLDNLNIQGRLQQFDLKHGNNAIRIDGWLIYSDGAMRETNPLGALCEPPGNPYECCKIKVQYHEELLRRAVDEFNTTKHRFMLEASARLRYGDPSPISKREAVQTLTTLQATVKDRQRKLRIAQQRLDAVQPPALRARFNVEAENKQNTELLIEAISEIRI